MDLSGYEVPRVLVTCRSRQIYDENDDDENVPLNYYITNDLSIQFGREEFCLVTGLRFGVENWEEYDNQENLPFRRRVFPSHLDGKTIKGCGEIRRIVPQWLLRIANDRVAWNKYPWGSYVWPTLYSQLRNANVRRWSQFYVEETTNENDAKTYSLCGYTWAFKTWILESFRVTSIRYFYRSDRYPRVATWRKKKGRFLAEMVIPFFEGNIPAARLTPDDNEARSDWWISKLLEIKKLLMDIKEEMQKFREEMNARSVRQENTVPMVVGQHYGLSDFSEFRSMQGGPSSFMNMGTPPNFQTPMRSQPGSSDWQRQMPEQSASHYWQPSSHPGSYNSFARVPSHMGRQNLQTTIDTQHDVDGIVEQNIPNRGKRQQLPSKYLVTPFTVQAPTTMVLKKRVSKSKNKGKMANLSPLNLGGNVDPAKVWRGNYENSFIWVVKGVNAYQYEVSDGQYIREVNLQTGICGCRKWQLSGLLCGHLIAITRYLGLTDCVHYVADWFKKPKYQATYSESIHSIGNMQQWEFLENIQKAIPPRMDNPQPGRPKNTKRIQSQGEEPRIIRCTRCTQTGHRRDQCGQPFVVQPPVNIRTHNDKQFTQNNQLSFNNPTQFTSPPNREFVDEMIATIDPVDIDTFLANQVKLILTNYLGYDKNSPTFKHFGMWIFMGKRPDIRQLIEFSWSSICKDFNTPILLSGPSTLPCYIVRPYRPSKTILKYHQENASGSKLQARLCGKIRFTQGNNGMLMHPEQHTVNIGYTIH
ncbi:phospholipase-like protein [Tanacetum coccineum]